MTDRYRTKPAEVDAVRFDGTGSQAVALQAAGWCRYVEFNGGPPNTATVVCEVPNGQVSAEAGDWLVRGAGGVVRPITADEFAAAYETT